MLHFNREKKERSYPRLPPTLRRFGGREVVDRDAIENIASSRLAWIREGVDDDVVAPGTASRGGGVSPLDEATGNPMLISVRWRLS